MAQHDYVIDNSTGANVRADINNALLAISSNNSGSSAPSTTYALQSFANTTDSMLQLRNAANNAFVNLRKFDGALPLPDGSASSPSLFFDDDTNTGIFSGGADEFNISTGGTERFVITSAGRCGIGVTNPQAELVVRGSTPQVVLEPTSDSQNCRLQFATTDGTIQSHIMGGGSDGAAIKFITSTSERLRIDTSGNMGLGVTSISDARFRIKGANNSTSTFNDGLMITSNNETVYKKYSWAGIEAKGGVTFHEASSGSVVETVRIDSSGKVGIGNTSPASFDDSADLLVVGTTSGNNGITIVAGSSNHSSIYFADGTSGGSQKNAGIVDYNHSTDSMRFATAANTAMTIDSSQNVIIGDTSVIDNGFLSLKFNGTNLNGIVLKTTRTATGTDFIKFLNSDGNVAGKINHNGTTTVNYASTSDYRLKENVISISNAITRLKTLKPYRFNFKSEPDRTVDGFLAHEVTAVPEAITGTKDEVDADNKPVYQGIDQSKLVPLLVAAVQELIGKVEALETA